MTLVSVEDHQATIAALLGVAPAAEDVAVRDALGRVLAAPVSAPEQLPTFDNSAMDGYAVRAQDIAAATETTPVLLPVAGDVPAGASVGELAPGTALRIMTGAPVPVGADAVVEVEMTDGGTETVAIRAAREAGRFVRPAGSDVRAGAEVLAAGAQVGAAQLGLLVALGVRTVQCVRRPRVLVLSTGSELAEDPQPGSGLIRDSNGPMLAAAVTEAGCVAVPSLSTSDDVEVFLAALDGALADAEGIDLVLTSGGVSAGAYEVVKDAFGPRGVAFTKVAMQPGMPQGHGTYAGVPVVCLPGNPVSSLVSFEVFVRPALRRLAGFARTTRPVVRAALTEALGSPAGKRQLRRARLGTDGTVTVWGPAGSGFLGWYAGADALIDIPADVTELPAGSVVEVWDLL